MLNKATWKLRKPALAQRYGVTPKTIDRWNADPTLGFPAPMDVHGIPFWMRPRSNPGSVIVSGSERSPLREQSPDQENAVR